MSAVASISSRILSQLRGSCEQSLGPMLIVLQRQAVPASVSCASPPARPPVVFDEVISAMRGGGGIFTSLFGRFLNVL